MSGKVPSGNSEITITLKHKCMHFALNSPVLTKSKLLNKAFWDLTSVHLSCLDLFSMSKAFFLLLPHTMDIVSFAWHVLLLLTINSDLPFKFQLRCHLHREIPHDSHSLTREYLLFYSTACPPLSQYLSLYTGLLCSLVCITCYFKNSGCRGYVLYFFIPWALQYGKKCFLN